MKTKHQLQTKMTNQSIHYWFKYKIGSFIWTRDIWNEITKFKIIGLSVEKTIDGIKGFYLIKEDNSIVSVEETKAFRTKQDLIRLWDKKNTNTKQYVIQQV
ncbi:MAG: hypothetical protein IKA83_02435 [Paludibacteraceae bacterium]|nr:hypothetical protein [Paludibacteraceae bacterium]